MIWKSIGGIIQQGLKTRDRIKYARSGSTAIFDCARPAPNSTTMKHPVYDIQQLLSDEIF